MGAIEAGLRADLVVLDHSHIDLEGRNGEALMDSFLFNSGPCAVKNVMVGGRWVVRDGRHRDEDRIEKNFRDVQKQLLA